VKPLGPSELTHMIRRRIRACLCVLTLTSPLVEIAAAQQPVDDAVPQPAGVEEALANERRARNPTFVEYQASPVGRALVVGVPYSPQSLNADPLDDFQSIDMVLLRRKWIQHFVEIHLVVPQPLMKVRISIDDVRRLQEHELTQEEFREKWRIDKLGPS